MKKLAWVVVTVFLIGCKKQMNKAEFCNYANVKPQYEYLFEGQEIKKCEVLSFESQEQVVLEEKVMGHQAKIKLVIEQTKDDCISARAMRCGMLKEGCIKEGDQNADSCKYPDAKVQTAKGTVREQTRNIILASDKDLNRFEVLSNTEVK